MFTISQSASGDPVSKQLMTRKRKDFLEGGERKGMGTPKKKSEAIVVGTEVILP